MYMSPYLLGENITILSEMIMEGPVVLINYSIIVIGSQKIVKARGGQICGYSIDISIDE